MKSEPFSYASRTYELISRKYFKCWCSLINLRQSVSTLETKKLSTRIAATSGNVADRHLRCTR